MKDVLDGKTTLRVHVHKSDDIAAVLRLVDEFKLKITIEHACNVYQKETFAKLAKRGIPVVCGPIEGIGSKVELKNMNWRNLKVMIDSGVKFGVMTAKCVDSDQTAPGLAKHLELRLCSISKFHFEFLI